MSIKGNTPKFDIGKTTEKYSFNDFKMLQEFYNKNTELVLREKEFDSLSVKFTGIFQKFLLVLMKSGLTANLLFLQHS